METVQEWLGTGLYKTLGPYLEGELGAETVDDLRMLEPEHLATVRGMLKPLPLKRFNLQYAELMGAGVASGQPSIPEGVAEKPARAAAATVATEPEPETATREVHAAGPVVAIDVAGSADWELSPIQPSKTSDFSAALCIFGSMRFPVPAEARLLFAALQAAGVYLKIVDMRAGQDIDKEVYEWIEHCHAFLAFGTKNYGEDTGNSACTYNEVKFAQAKKKNIILLRMIPWEEEFEELQARVLFNRNMLTLEWQQGQAMPPSLVGEILKAMDLPPNGVAGSRAALAHQTTVAEASKAQAQAQIAQAHASAAAAKAEAEAMQAQGEAEQAMAIAAAEEEAARRVQEEARAVQIAERLVQSSPTAIIVIGGWDGSSRFSSGERYDPAANAWSPIASMGTARSDHAAVVIDSLLYAIGGITGDGSILSSGERYDPAANAWSPIASMGTARAHHATVVIDGLLYAIGGWDGSSRLSSGERYDPVANAWSPIASMGTARDYHAAVAIDGLLYAIGGWDGSSGLSSGERYDPAANAWSPIASMGTARDYHAAVAIDGLLYAIGGSPGGGVILCSGERYDPAANAWSPTASMGTARYGSAAAMIDGLLYAIGGVDDGSSFVSSGERYDPATNAWSPIASMGTAREYHAAAALVVY